MKQNQTTDGLRRRKEVREEDTQQSSPLPAKQQKLPIPERITENMQIKPMQDEVSLSKF